MAVWEARVTATDIVETIPGPGAFGYAIFSGTSTLAEWYAFVAADLPDGTRYPTILVFRQLNDDGTLATFEQHGFSIAGDANAGFVLHGEGTDEFTGSSGVFTSGGTITITKDETAQEYQYQGLVGSSTVPFSSLVGGVSDGEMAPESVWLANGSISTWDDGTHFAATEQDTELTVRWSDFFGSLNGSDIKGANLGTGDTGAWEPSGGPFDPWFTAFSGDVTGATADTGTAIGFTITVDGTGPIIGPSGTAFRRWDQSVYLASHNPFSLALDAVLCRFSGNLYVLRVASTEPEEVFFAVSRDRGASWQEQSLSTIGGGQMVWPTLDVDPTGKILALWQDRNEPTRRYWTVSETYGQTWLAVQSEVVTAFSSQRARYHPMTGWLFYVFRDTDALQLRVAAYDAAGLAGFTAAAPWVTPRTVTAAAAENWPAVNFDRKGEVQLQWAEMQRAFSLSENLGVDWTTSTSEPMTTKAQPSVINDEESGLQYVLHQHPSTGDLACFASDDGAVNELAGGPSGTVVAAADQQYAAVVTDHRGHVYAIFQELSLGSYAIRCRRSDSLSATWVNA